MSINSFLFSLMYPDIQFNHSPNTAHRIRDQSALLRRPCRPQCRARFQIDHGCLSHPRVWVSPALFGVFMLQYFDDYMTNDAVCFNTYIMSF